MKNAMLTLTLLLAAFAVGCGGSMKTAANPVASPTPVVTSAQVFSNVPQTWNFADSVGHHMTIDTKPIPCAFGSCGDIAVQHFTKGDPTKSLAFNCAGYWNTRTPEQCAVATTLDELYFVLRHDADGAWRCIGFTDIDYLGNKWKVQINPWSGRALPYTIIPVSSAVSDPNTGYDGIVKALAFDADLTDFSPITGSTSYSATWRTDSSVDNGNLISDQNEGCVKEHWVYDAKGLRLITPIVGLGNGGACVNVNPKLTMERTN